MLRLCYYRKVCTTLDTHRTSTSLRFFSLFIDAVRSFEIICASDSSRDADCLSSLAMTMGHSPYIPSDRTIELASDRSNPHNLPSTIHEAVAIQMFCNKVHCTMGELDRLGLSASRPSSASSLKLLEADLQDLKRHLGHSTSRKYNVSR